MYNSVVLEGLILRPGSSTRIQCGTATDTGGGECKSLCPTPPEFSVDSFDPWAQGRDGCNGGSWRARDFGTYLYRYMRWQTEVQARGGKPARVQTPGVTEGGLCSQLARALGSLTSHGGA